MSIHHMSQVWNSCIDVAGNDLLVLLALADYANEYGWAWPSVASLVSRTRTSERTVQRALRRLEEAGQIERKDRPGTSAMYRLCLPAEDDSPPVTGDTPANLTPPSQVTPHPRHGWHPTPVTHDTRSTNEPPTTRHKNMSLDVDGFEEFWTEYPRHASSGKPGGGASKKKTREHWDKLDVEQRSMCLVGVEHYAEFIERDDAPFPCHATTWLSQERWESWQEPAAKARGPTGPRHVDTFDKTEEF